MENIFSSIVKDSLQHSQAKLSSMVVHELKAICRSEGLPISGRKADLLTRITNRLKERTNRASMSPEAFESLTGRILYFPLKSPSLSEQTRPDASSFAYGGWTRPSQPNNLPKSSVNDQVSIRFFDSPFYIQKSVVGSVKLPACPSNRHEVGLDIGLSQSQLIELRQNNSLRLLAYCAELPVPYGSGPVHINFPTQIELRVNEQEVKASLKKVGKRDGSIKPVDCTAFLRKSGFTNVFKAIYARTSKHFQIVLMLAEKRSTQVLLQQIQTQAIPKLSVMVEMKAKSEDADIEISSTNMSLKDGSSQMRIQIPIRSLRCSHNMCFDAHTFLQMQEQAPLWSCPICDKPAPLESLAVDKYFEDILNNTNSSVDSVTVRPDGTWKADEKAISNDIDSDADSIEIVEMPAPRAMSSNLGGTPTSYSIMTPNSAQSSTISKGQKRQAEVIDLTLSDDDEEPRAPHPKRSRPSVIHTSSGSLLSYDNRNFQSPPKIAFSLNGQRSNTNTPAPLSRPPPTQRPSPWPSSPGISLQSPGINRNLQQFQNGFPGYHNHNHNHTHNHTHNHLHDACDPGPNGNWQYGP